MATTTKTENAEHYSAESSKPANDEKTAAEKNRMGWPGFLLTCERGRELKCEREGLEILRHYIHRIVADDNGSDHNSGGKDSHSLKERSSVRFTGNLDLELEKLREQQKRRGKCRKETTISDFLSVLDTGCKGTVFVRCSRPNLRLIPLGSSEYNNVGHDSNVSDADTSIVMLHKRTRDSCLADFDSTISQSDGDPKKKRSKLSQLHGNSNNIKGSPDTAIGNSGADSTTLLVWDPVSVVESIFREASPDFSKRQHSSGEDVTPSSRFVTRVIPIQATCCASLLDIQETARVLLQRFFSIHQSLCSIPNLSSSREKDEMQQTTFGIFVKRRNCSHLSSQQIIEGLAANVLTPPLLPSSWKVNLKYPDVKVWVEVCRTTAGISVFKMSPSSIFRTGSGSNFNLAEVRASSKT